MTKALRKAIMLIPHLKNVCLKNRNANNWNDYKKHRNFYCNLLKKSKKAYFEELNLKNLNDNRKFWNTMKPLFSNH